MPAYEIVGLPESYSKRRVGGGIRGMGLSQDQGVEPELPSTGMGEDSESGLGMATRTGARTLARAGETIAGTPGNLLSLALNAGNWVTGKKIPGSETIQEYATSEGIKKHVTEGLTGEYLKPQGKGEEYWDEFVGDTAGLLVPFLGTAAKGGKTLAMAGKALGKAAAVAGVAQGAGHATEKLFDSPIAGTGVKLGVTLLGTTALGSKLLSTAVKDRYETADKLAKELNLSGSTDKLGKELGHARSSIAGNAALNKAEKDVLEEIIDSSLKNIHPEQALSPADTLAETSQRSQFFAPEVGREESLRIIAPGTQVTQPAGRTASGIQLPGTQTTTVGRDIAKELKTAAFNVGKGGSEVSLPSNLTVDRAMGMLKEVNSRYAGVNSQSRKVLDKINGALNRFIKEAAKDSPEFLQNFTEAQDLWKGMHSGPEWLQKMHDTVSVRKFMENWKPLSMVGSGLLYMGRPTTYAAGAAIGTLFAGKHAAQFVNLMVESPTARKLMKESLGAAAKGSAASYINNIKKLDKVAAKEGY